MKSKTFKKFITLELRANTGQIARHTECRSIKFSRNRRNGHANARLKSRSENASQVLMLKLDEMISRCCVDENSSDDFGQEMTHEEGRAGESARAHVLCVIYWFLSSFFHINQLFPSCYRRIPCDCPVTRLAQFASNCSLANFHTCKSGPAIPKTSDHDPIVLRIIRPSLRSPCGVGGLSGLVCSYAAGLFHYCEQSVCIEMVPFASIKSRVSDERFHLLLSQIKRYDSNNRTSPWIVSSERELSKFEICKWQEDPQVNGQEVLQESGIGCQDCVRLSSSKGTALCSSTDISIY
ncbi:unnamed protein product [Nesidiocoris tenuis]|uniref:Uncharacterized protein n=1 Tax=Nesidiocoris tenuis TaxID=355587 RepID=A0A6H5GL35_9HEMI|nr:unnamed protein product [Nesidiocoris tenuis]